MQGSQPQAPAFTPPAQPANTSGILPPTADLSQVPQNDEQLQAYLASASPMIKSVSGLEQKALSDKVYNGIAAYASANPGSAIAQAALDAAHRNAPPGHTFPAMNQRNANPRNALM